MHKLRRAWLALAALLAGMGVVLEFLQRMTGYRYFDYADMLANGAGVLLGGGLRKLRWAVFFSCLKPNSRSWRAAASDDETATLHDRFPLSSSLPEGERDKVSLSRVLR